LDNDERFNAEISDNEHEIQEIFLDDYSDCEVESSDEVPIEYIVGYRRYQEVREQKLKEEREKMQHQMN